MDENLLTILSMGSEALRVVRDDLDNQIIRENYLIRSAEAKLDRVEPLSDEFEQTVQIIEEAKRRINSFANDRHVIHAEICRREMKYWEKRTD